MGSALEGLWGRGSIGDTGTRGEIGTLLGILGLGRAQGLWQEALVPGETLVIQGGTGIPDLGRGRALGR